jgi:hypothetical protein
MNLQKSNRMKNIIVFTFILMLQQSLFAQSSEFPYDLDLKKDIIIGGISGLSFLSENFVAKQNHNESQSYFNGLNKNDINSFDRSATKNWNPDSDALRENLNTVGVWGGVPVH